MTKKIVRVGVVQATPALISAKAESFSASIESSSLPDWSDLCGLKVTVPR